MRWTVFLFLLSAFAIADDADLTLPHRTTVAVQLDTRIRTNHARAGDLVAATVVSPVLLHGVVVLPKAAKLRGLVVVVQPHTNGVMSRLIVRFEEAQWAQQTMKLNAFIVHQIIEKRVIVSEVAGDCAPADSQPAMPPRPSRGSLTPWSGCPNGSVGGTTEQQTVLTTPEMKDITVRRSKNPPRTIELVSAKKDIDLPRGTLLELRHLAPPGP